MLQKMRDNTQSLGFKILVGALVFVLAVFGFGAFNLFVNPDPEVAVVNGDDITQSQLAAETERARLRMLQQLPEGTDPSTIDTLTIQNQVLDQLVNRQLLLQTADDLQLAAAKRRVDQLIIDTEAFQVDGQFNEDRYVALLRQQGYTPVQFAQLAADDMVLSQLQGAVGATAVVPEWQLRWLVALMQQKRDLAYLPLERAHFSERAEVSEEEIAQHYEDNRLAFQTEESLDLAYVELSWEDLLEAAQADVTEEAARNSYEQDRQAAAADEQRSASHILLRTGDERTEAEAIAEAEQLIAQLNTGADFAELAEAHSGDPGSAANGGDLGPAGKGVFVPEFEEALFALEEGQLSAPVATQFGVHIIRLDEIIVPTYPSFEELRAEIEQSLAEDAARAAFVDAQREFDGLAFEQNDQLEGLASTFGLTIREALGVTRSSGEGIMEQADLRDVAFSEDVLEKGYNSAAVSSGEDRAVVLRLKERHLPRELSLAEVRDEIEQTLRDEKAQQEIERAAADGLARLESGEPVGTIAEELGLEWQAFALAGTSEPGVPFDVSRAAFDLPPPAAGEKSVGQAELDDGVALVTVTRVENGDIEAMTEQQVDGLRRFIVQRNGNLDFSGMFESVRASASIRR